MYIQPKWMDTQGQTRHAHLQQIIRQQGYKQNAKSKQIATCGHRQPGEANTPDTLI